MWLILDREVGQDPTHPGDSRYFIFYDQRFINENPLHIFDENKPAWVDHTTMPHTLAGAMINISRPFWPTRSDQEKVVLADPFGGTGTIWLESVKHTNVHCISSDISPLARLLVEDNANFFSASLQDLKRFADALKYAGKPALQRPRAFTSCRIEMSLADHYKRALDIFEKYVAFNDVQMAFSDNLPNALEKVDFCDRLMFYVVLRTARRNVAAFERRSTEWQAAYQKEAMTLAGQIEELLILERRANRTVRVSKGIQDICQGDYSESCTILGTRFLQAKEKLQDSVSQRSVLELEKNSCDVIITDPPYGFNTKDDVLKLARLYSDSITAMIEALRDEGQLILAVPDWSHVGRHLPFFALKSFLIQQVLTTSSRLGREVVIPANLVPKPGAIFRPPYYWESERALRRAILHFRIRRIGL